MLGHSVWRTCCQIDVDGGIWRTRHGQNRLHEAAPGAGAGEGSELRGDDCPRGRAGKVLHWFCQMRKTNLMLQLPNTCCWSTWACGSALQVKPSTWACCVSAQYSGEFHCAQSRTQ